MAATPKIANAVERNGTLYFGASAKAPSVGTAFRDRFPRYARLFSEPSFGADVFGTAISCLATAVP
jgi:hypothetical protein